MIVEDTERDLDVPAVLVQTATISESRDTARRHENACAVIRTAILRGTLPPGTKIPENAVIESLSISRTPVREAFRILEGEGLIAYSPSRGVIVRGLSRADLIDICEMLESLEPLAARLAADRATIEQINEIKEALDLMQFHAGRDQWTDVTKNAIRFHELIYDASGNRQLRDTLIHLRTYVRSAREDSLARPGRGDKSVDEHATLFNSISKHDPDQAAENARIHIRNFRQHADI